MTDAHMFSGLIVKGDGIGRTLGYPTANLNIAPRKINMKNGVYAAHATLRGATYDAALIIQEQVQKVEVYLLAYRGDDFYGDTLEVQPIQKVSEIEHMEFEELKQKIEQDICAIREVLEFGDDGAEC